MTAQTGWYFDRSRVPGIAVEAPPSKPKDDPFYKYDPAQLPGKPPGTVLRTRERPYHLDE